MMHVDIRIAATVDARPIFPEHIDVEESELAGVGILEGGMASGRTSVAMIVVHPNGSKCLVQMSADTLLAIAGAVKGAVQRFGK